MHGDASIFLQGLKYNNLTNIRTSEDRFEPSKWKYFLFTSQLGYEIGAWPWCDVFKSHETGNMILSVLSSGPVGTGDAIGKENKENIYKACRPDRVIVKPDAPILPLDKDYIQLAKKEDKPILASTYTKHGNIITNYLFAFCEKKNINLNFSFVPKELNIHNNVIVYNPETQIVKELQPNDVYNDKLPDDKYAYYIIAPIINGIAFLGDKNKIAATGKKRIEDIEQTNGGLRIKILFAKNEKEITLLACSKNKLSLDVGNLGYDNLSNIYSINISKPENKDFVIINLVCKK